MARVWFALENSNDFSFPDELQIFSDLIYLKTQHSKHLTLPKKVLKHRTVLHSTHEKYEMTKEFCPFFLASNTHMNSKHYLVFRKRSLIFFSSEHSILFILCTRFVTWLLYVSLNIDHKPIFIMYICTHPIISLNFWFSGVLGPRWPWCHWTCSTCKIKVADKSPYQEISQGSVTASPPPLKKRNMFLSKQTNSLSFTTLWFSSFLTSQPG